MTFVNDHRKKTGNLLLFLKDALNIFYLWLHGVGYMIKVHTDNETENPLLLLHGLYFEISSKGCFKHHPLWSTDWFEF